MKEGEEKRERGEENGTDYIAKLLFAQAGVIFDYIGQRISCVGVQKRGGGRISGACWRHCTPRRWAVNV